MAVVAKIKISTRDKEGNLETYEAGSIVKGITKKEEEQLIKDGFAARNSVETGE